MTFLKLAVIAFLVFLVIDFVWLVFISRKLYDRELKAIKKEKINWVAAGIFYVIYIIGIVFFVISPKISDGFTKLANFSFSTGNILKFLCLSFVH